MDAVTAQVLQKARMQCINGQKEEAFDLVKEYASNNPEIFEAWYFLSRTLNYVMLPTKEKQQYHAYRFSALITIPNNTSPEQSIVYCEIAEKMTNTSKETANHYLLKSQNNNFIPDFIIDEINHDKDIDIFFSINTCLFFLYWQSISPFDDPLLYGELIWKNNSISIQNFTIAYFIQRYREGDYKNNLYYYTYPTKFNIINEYLKTDPETYYHRARKHSRSQSMRDQCDLLIQNIKNQ